MFTKEEKIKAMLYAFIASGFFVWKFDITEPFQQLLMPPVFLIMILLLRSEKKPKEKNDGKAD